MLSNFGKGLTRGIELWGQWQPSPVWRLNWGGVVQHLETSLMPGSHATGVVNGLSTNDPAHHWMLRTSHDLTDQLQLDLSLRYMGQLPQPVVPSYTELDLQLLWKPQPDVEVALLGQNLLHSSHPEFNGAGRSVFDRAALLKLTKRF